MEINLSKTDNTNATLTVNLSESDYAEKVSAKIKDYSRKAQIKGFRPGKVPAALIQRMYGKSLLVEQINEMLGEAVNGYIRENNLRLLGEPLPRREEADQIDWDNQKDFTFHYDLGLVPDFDVPTDGSLSVEGYNVSLDETTLNQTYEHLAKQFGKMTNPDVSEKGDFMYGELKQDSTEFQAKTLIPTNQVKAGIEKFVGVKPGDTLTFDIRETFGDDNSALAHVTGLSKDNAKDLSGEFTFSVEKINRQGSLEMNQELFDKVFGPGTVDSEEAFRSKVEATVKENYDREARGLLYRQLIEKLIQNTRIDLPTEFLKRWVAFTNKNKASQEDIDQAVENQLDGLKWNLIKNRLAEKMNVEVKTEEIVARTKEKIRQQLNMPYTEELEGALENYANNFLQQENGKHFMEEHDALLTDKVLEAVLPQVAVNEKPITAEEFRNLTF